MSGIFYNLSLSRGVNKLGDFVSGGRHPFSEREATHSHMLQVKATLTDLLIHIGNPAAAHCQHL